MNMYEYAKRTSSQPRRIYRERSVCGGERHMHASAIMTDRRDGCTPVYKMIEKERERGRERFVADSLQQQRQQQHQQLHPQRQWRYQRCMQQQHHL